MYVVAYETSSLIYHAKPVCYVCNRCFLFLLKLKWPKNKNFDQFLIGRKLTGAILDLENNVAEPSRLTYMRKKARKTVFSSRFRLSME